MLETKPRRIVIVTYFLIIIILLAYFWIGGYKLNQIYKETTKLWRIPVRISNSKNPCTFVLDGASLRKVIREGENPVLDDGKTVKISFKSLDEIGGGAIRGRLSSGKISALLLSDDKRQSSWTYLQKDWEVIFGDLSSKNTHIVLPEAVEEDDGNREFVIEDDTRYDIEIRDMEFEAELIFNPTPHIHPQNESKITLLQKKAPVNSEIEYEFSDTAEITSESRISVMFFCGNKVIKVGSLVLQRREGLSGLRGKVRMPRPLEFNPLLEHPMRALAIVSGPGDNWMMRYDNVSVLSKVWGLIWGILAVVGFYIAVILFRASPFLQERYPDRFAKWQELTPFKRFTRRLLIFAVSDTGHFWISYAQIFWWTSIVIFALTFVVVTRLQFLEITSQMLWLLGISGSTALISRASRVISQRRIPVKYMQGIKFNRIPRFRDLISINDSLNLYKVQILAFSICAGFFVLYILWTQGAFPELDDTLLILMGISSGTYVFGDALTENRINVIFNMHKKIETLEKDVENIYVLGYDKSEIDTEVVKTNYYIIDHSKNIADKLLSEINAILPELYKKIEAGDASAVEKELRDKIAALSKVICKDSEFLGENVVTSCNEVLDILCDNPELESIYTDDFREVLSEASVYRCRRTDVLIAEMKSLEKDLLKAREVLRHKKEMRHYITREFTDPSDWSQVSESSKA